MRITTAKQLIRHMADRYPRTKYDAATRISFARCVAYNSNTRHNPKSGFLEWMPDAPTWIIRFVEKYKGK
jgi:hypothetical protein